MLYSSAHVFLVRIYLSFAPRTYCCTTAVVLVCVYCCSAYTTAVVLRSTPRTWYILRSIPVLLVPRCTLVPGMPLCVQVIFNTRYEGYSYEPGLDKLAHPSTRSYYIMVPGIIYHGTRYHILRSATVPVPGVFSIMRQRIRLLAAGLRVYTAACMR